MSENNNRPKVEIALNQEARLKLVRDKAYTGQNSYGNFYLYTVIEGDVEKSFFATEDVHKRILEEGLKTGDEFLVRKKPVQNGKKIQAKIDFEVVSRAPVPSTPNGNGNGNGHSDDFKALMKACVSEAVDITKEVNTIPWQNEDVRSIALTMFIQRARLN
jgi:hypothetical protein